MRFKDNISFLRDLMTAWVRAAGASQDRTSKAKERRGGRSKFKPWRAFLISLERFVVKPTTPAPQPLRVNEKVATSDRTPSVMTARPEYLWEIMDHGKKRGSHEKKCSKAFA